MLDIEQLCSDVYRKHHKRLDPNDPIFMTITMNEMLMANYLEQFQAALENHESMIQTKSKDIANAYLEKSAEQSNQLLTAMHTSFQNTEERINAVVKQRIQEIQDQSNRANQKIAATVKMIQPIGYLCVGFVAFSLGFFIRTFLFH
jgi:hypothetical protein